MMVVVGVEDRLHLDNDEPGPLAMTFFDRATNKFPPLAATVC
jgi:hypothetical protein